MARLKAGKGRCIICGKETSSADYRDAPIYCEEHRAYADMDDEIIQNAPIELLFVLITGIFFRARLDYLTDSDGQRIDAEQFLRSAWAQELSLSHFDVEELLDRLDEEIEHGFEYRFESTF